MADEDVVPSSHSLSPRSPRPSYKNVLRIKVSSAPCSAQHTSMVAAPLAADRALSSTVKREGQSRKYSSSQSADDGPSVPAQLSVDGTSHGDPAASADHEAADSAAVPAKDLTSKNIDSGLRSHQYARRGRRLVQQQPVLDTATSANEHDSPHQYDETLSKPGSVSHKPSALHASPAAPVQHKGSAKADPLQNLRIFIESLGGVLGEGWKVEQGKSCKVYFSPSNKKFTARTQVARYLGLPLHYRVYAGKYKHENLYRTNQISATQAKDTEHQCQLDADVNSRIHHDQSMASINAASSVKADHFQAFKAYIEGLGGSLEEGWRIEPRDTYTVYYSPNNTKFTARAQVAKYLGLPLQYQKKNRKQGRRGNRKIRAILAAKRYHHGKHANGVRGNQKVKTSERNTQDSPNNLERQDIINQTKIEENGGSSSHHVSNVANATNDNNLGKWESPSATLITERCQDVFQNIISAEKFASLSNMLSRALPYGCMGDVSQLKNSAPFASPSGIQLISFRLSTGAYGKSPELFSEDIKQVWKEIAAIGNELVSMATSLSELSDNLYKEQVSSLFEVKERVATTGKALSLVAEAQMVTRKLQEKRNTVKQIRQTETVISKVANHICKVCGKAGSADSFYICKNCNEHYHIFCVMGPPNGFSSKDWCCSSCKTGLRKQNALVDEGTSDFELVLPSTTTLSNDGSSETNREPCKTAVHEGICKACGKDDGHVLLCDSCDAAYHMNCLKPAIKSIPDGFWYCPVCEAEARKKTSLENGNENGHHCVVCERVQNESLIHFGGESLENGTSSKNNVEGNLEANRSAEVSVASDSSKVHGHTMNTEGVCKICGVSCQKATVQCSACTKWYHLTCLRPEFRDISSEIWYCPSCLCCACRIDVDDDKILLCDACDEGYHTYCLSPPIKRVPKGLWFCARCARLGTGVVKEEVELTASKSTTLKVSKGKRKHTEISDNS